MQTTIGFSSSAGVFHTASCGSMMIVGSPTRSALVAHVNPRQSVVRFRPILSAECDHRNVLITLIFRCLSPKSDLAFYHSCDIPVIVSINTAKVIHGGCIINLHPTPFTKKWWSSDNRLLLLTKYYFSLNFATILLFDPCRKSTAVHSRKDATWRHAQGGIRRCRCRTRSHRNKE